jgi:uncharacterized protein YkwD
MEEFGYRYKTFEAENIAAGNQGAIETFCQWKNSPGHNKNMLAPRAAVIGIGCAENPDSKYGYYWNTTFGGIIDALIETPQGDDSSCPMPAALPKC